MEQIQLEWRPAPAKTIEETGLSEEVVEGLLLKTLKQEGSKTAQDLGMFLALSPNILQPFLASLKQRKMVEVQAGMKYALTEAGRELWRVYDQEDNYVGPAPVSFEQYCQMVKLQDDKEKRVGMDELREVGSKYQYREEQLRYFKEAFNSRRSVLFYGPPGNGKSLVTGLMHSLLKTPVLIPYAFEFNKKIVKVYDPAFHKILEKEEKKTDGKPLSAEELQARMTGQSVRYDRRWLVCRAPLVVVGTEFRVKHFEINFVGHYIAPPHLKANNGIFILDDLGRQIDSHTMILNQFIYPLESREMIIAFPGGSSLIAPYRQRLFVSTNLNKNDIIDDAFNRRLLYQILVPRPDKDTYSDIFVAVAKSFGVEESREEELRGHVKTLLEWYDRDQRSVRACDPRNLFVMMESALDEGETVNDRYNEDLLKHVYMNYPIARREDEISYQ